MYNEPVSNRDALRKEIQDLPDSMLGEVVDFVRILKSKKRVSGEEFWKLLRETHGCIPDLVRPPQGQMPPAKNLS